MQHAFVHGVYIKLVLMIAVFLSRNRNEGSFEVVAHNKSTSHRHAEQTKATSGAGPRLSIGNRFNTLDNDS